MKTLIAIICMLATPSIAAAQDMEHFQHLADEAASVLREKPVQRGVAPYAMPDFRVVVTTKIGFNAEAVVSEHVIYLGATLVDVLQRDGGELLFVVAHEIGHLQDDAHCREEGAARRLTGIALQRMCESRADLIGLQYLMAAGWSPFDAAGLMGRLMLADGQTSILGIMIGRYTSDHPVDVDRIKHLASYTAEICRQRPELCRR